MLSKKKIRKYNNNNNNNNKKKKALSTISPEGSFTGVSINSFVIGSTNSGGRVCLFKNSKFKNNISKKI
jgi:hypothetical protein